MILGFILGIIMRDWGGVIFGSIASTPIGVLTFHFLQRPVLVSEGHTITGLTYALVALESLVVVFAVAAVTYLIKRAIVRPRA
jgi:hypothetical protein